MIWNRKVMKKRSRTCFDVTHAVVADADNVFRQHETTAYDR